MLAFSSEELGALNARWRSGRPFQHVVIDGLFPDAALAPILDETPPPESPRWTIWGSGADADAPDNSSKRGISSVLLLGEHTRRFLQGLTDPTFLNFLSAITGVDGLTADPTFNGGGLHRTGRGGFLRVHADKDRHPRPHQFRQAVNVIVFLCHDWLPSYGGHLELWSDDGTRCIQTIVPAFNRLVIMETNATTFHGQPTPLNCPADRFRLTIASYYYTRIKQDSSPGVTHIRWL